jgi:hypothetical protein
MYATLPSAAATATESATRGKFMLAPLLGKEPQSKELWRSDLMEHWNGAGKI